MPDKIWNETVLEQFRKKVLCINCFSTFADEQLIEWDKDIQFYPASLKTMLVNTVQNTMKKILLTKKRGNNENKPRNC